MTTIIKGIRILRGYTQEDVADAIGMTVRTYCKKESNPMTFTIAEIQRLSVFLNVNEEIFFKKEVTISAT